MKRELFLGGTGLRKDMLDDIVSFSPLRGGASDGVLLAVVLR